MITLSINKVQAQLPELIRSLPSGEKLAITDDTHVVATLIIAPRPKPIPAFGSCRGLLTILVEDNEHLQHFREYMPHTDSSDMVE